MTKTKNENHDVDLREVMVESFTTAAEAGLNIAVAVSDSTSTSKIAPFRERFPDRVINVGIAEQSLVGTAVGMSLGGYIAITANAAPFLISRANEQVKTDVCYSNTNVKLMGINAGFAYGPLASTHHSIDDISVLRGFGNILIFAPADPIEARQIFEFAWRHVGPVYIRLDSGNYPQIHKDDYQFKPGQIDILNPGEGLAIVASGTVVREAVDAVAQLKQQGYNPTLINMSSIRPFDKKALIETLQTCSQVITVEEHSKHGGIGSLVAEVIAEEQLGLRLTRLGIEEGEFAKAGPRDQVRAYHKIDAAGIITTAKKVLE